MLVNNRSDNIQVIVRTKPGVKGCVEIDPVDSSKLKVGDREFFFDYILPQSAQQEDVFQIIGLPLVTNALKGFNGCVFTYGQTGSGKTHTLVGDNDGILPKSLEYCFGSTYDKNKIIKASFIEIYNERIFDLLVGGDKQLQLREDLKLGTYVQDLTETVISNYDEALNLLKKGQVNRHVAATRMNSESSRSHALFIIQYASSQEEEKYATHYSAKLNFVDLAGSERQKSAGTEGERLKEASAINKSLSNLGTVISSIVEVNKGKQLHIPYRDSKLTNLLKNCLGGNSKTFMLATINPEHLVETISTLKFADRVKQIRNKAQINKEITGEEVTKLQQQLKNLLIELEEKNKRIAEIQPTDTLQFQLQQEFQNIKEILMAIHSIDLNSIESQCDAFNERKSIISQLLRNLNFPISFGNDILGQMEVESKLQYEIIQKDELIYKLQKKLREQEQKNYDQQNFYKVVQQQQQRNYEEQLKHKEDMIFQLKDDIDTSEISKFTLQRQLDELNLRFNQFNQESMNKQGDILEEEQLIRDQEITIKDQQSQIEQMCARFESLKLQFTQVQETVIYKEEQVFEITKMNQNQRDQLEVLHEKMKQLQKLSEFERLYENERIMHNQLKQKYQEFETKALNTSEQQFIQIQQLQGQIESYECHEDTLEQENLIYRETIRQLEIQMEQITQSQNHIRTQFGLRGDDILGELARRTEIVQKSKMKHQNECLLIKQQNQIQMQNLNMRMKRVQDLEAQNMELLQENDQLKLQLESGAGEQQIIIMNLESKINELKIDGSKLRQVKVQLQAENTALSLQQQECSKFLNYMLAKLRLHTQNTYRRNRALTAQQQQYFLLATAANATPFSEIQNYVELILLDNPDKSVEQSQYRRSAC